MIGWIAALAIITAAGVLAWRIEVVRNLDVAARIAIALTFGTVVSSVLMFVQALAGVPWSPAALGAPLLALSILGVYASRRDDPHPIRLPRSASWLAPIALLLAYGAFTARMTIGDLLYFWGPKAQHFYVARTIDVEFLRFPHYYLMHPDYPPLVPAVWALCAVLAEGFTWWGPLLWSVIALVSAAFVFRGFASGAIGDRRATAFAALLLSLLVYATAQSRAAGGGDPMLLLFVTVTLSALTFSRPSRGAIAVAAVSLAGAVFTKVEGAAFAGTVFIALLMVRRLRDAFAVIAPATLLLAVWIGFAQHHALIDAYGRSGRAFHLDKLGFVLTMAGWQLSYGAFYLPWVAAMAPLVFARSLRRAALPLLVAAGTFSYSILFYLNDPDPLWWIQSSVERVMMTTLACLVVASAAASEYSPARDGLVPQGEKTEGGGGEANRHSGGVVDQV